MPGWGGLCCGTGLHGERWSDYRLEEEGVLRGYVGIYLAASACLARCGLLTLLLRKAHAGRGWPAQYREACTFLTGLRGCLAVGSEHL